MWRGVGKFGVVPLVVLLLVVLSISITSCKPDYNNALPDSSTLGNPRGKRMLRVITHLHSPYSWDACDQTGTANGILGSTCLNHLKSAVCTNKDDFVFLTDHPNAMSQYEIKDLLLLEPKDTLLTKNGAPYANQMGTCANNFSPTLLVGFESNLMAMGMTQHLDPSPDVRSTLYTGNDSTLAGLIRSTGGGLAFIPHTENRPASGITAIAPDGVEIYNFHANIDPKIRYTSLNAPPFLDIPGLLTYLIDPYNELIPDFAFMQFLQVFPQYDSLWNGAIMAGASATSSGTHIVGIGGTDSHENAFPQIVSDGERLDSHRRIVRFMSNHVIASSSDADTVKQAIKDGHTWVVFEGFGTPVQMDFYATLGATVVEMGNPGASLGSQTATITVKAPTLHPDSPGANQKQAYLQAPLKPTILLQLSKLAPDGSEAVVATSQNTDIQYVAKSPGVYLANVNIVPQHLAPYLGPFKNKAFQAFPWIITNPIYLDP